MEHAFSHFVEKLAWFEEKKNGNVAQDFPSTKWSSVHFRVSRWDQGSLRSPLYKMDFCIFEGFLYFKQPFCLHVCSCTVPHFVEASGCENHKSAPKKRGWVPWFCRDDALLHLWQVPHSVEIWGPQSQVWLYKMGTPNPPMSFFGGIFLSIYLPVHLSTSSTIAPVDPAIHVCHFHAYNFSSSIPRLPSFSKLLQNPHV